MKSNGMSVYDELRKHLTCDEMTAIEMALRSRAKTIRQREMLIHPEDKETFEINRQLLQDVESALSKIALD